MSSEYYPLEKTAEMLGLAPGEVTRLRERGELRAFRDGTSWKFRKVDVDNRVAQAIRERGAAANIDATVIAPQQDAVEAIDFDDSLDVVGDDVFELSLASAASEKPVPSKPAAPASPAPADDDLVAVADDDDVYGFDSNIALEESASVAALNEPESDVEFGLADEISSQIASDSSKVPSSKVPSTPVADDDDDDDLLTYVGQDSDIAITPAASAKVEIAKKPTPAAKAKAAAPKDDEADGFGFDVEAAMAEDSESASQVIAVDDVSDPFGTGGVPDFAAVDDDNASPVFGAASATGGDEVGGGFDSAFSGGMAAMPVATAASISTEPNYSWQSITLGLVPCLLFLCLSLGMMLDLIIHIWSWNQPSPFSSILLSLLGGML